jgi:hypothetical protein
MSGIHLLERFEVLLSLTTQTASRIPISDPIKMNGNIRPPYFAARIRTIRLNRPVIPIIGALRATLATIEGRVMGL